MKKISAIFFDFILINIISKILCQTLSKNFITTLNYSSEDNLYYIQLYLDEIKTTKKFYLDTTLQSISYYCDNITYKEKCENDDECFIYTKILINNIINNNIFEEISFNTDIEYKKTQNNYLKKEMDGALGLNNGNNTILEILYNLNLIDEKIFSICFSENFGYFGLGKMIGIDKYMEIGEEINFFDILSSDDNLFKLKINYIKINSFKIEQELLSIIDTSKYGSFFPKKLYDQIIIYLLLNNNNLKQDSEFGYCKLINKNEKQNFYDSFPDIILNFGNYIFTWKPKNYFRERYHDDKNDEIILCLSFCELKNNEDNDIIILGTDFMLDHEIVFNKNDQKIAFINTDCEKLVFQNDTNTNETIKNSLNKNSDNLTNNIDYSSDINNTNDEILNSTNIYYESLTSDNMDSSSSSLSKIDDVSDNEISDSETIDKNIDYISEYSTNLVDSIYNNESIINDTLYKAGIINTTIVEEIQATTQKINEEKNNNIENIKIDATQYIEKAQTTVVTEKAEIKIIQTTIIKVPTTIVKEDIQKQNINVKELEKESNNNTKITNQYNKRNSFFEAFKSFLKNKLIYFLLAFLGIILGFISIIFVSCAIISCVKYCKRKRRDYMEQVDVEVPRFSKDNNMSSFSYR